MLTTRELIARLDSRSKLEFSLEGVLPKTRGYSLLVGEPGRGKTNLCLNIAAGIAIGKDPVSGLSVHQGKVGYILFETPGLAAKLAKIEAYYGGGEAVPNFYLDETAPAGIFSLKKMLIEAFSGMDLGIIDPLNKVGVGNLSNPHDMMEMIRTLEEISKESGAHLLVVHHLRKKGNDPRYKFLPADLNDVKGANDLVAGSISTMLFREEYQTDLFSWGYGRGFPKKRGNDYLVLDFARAQASPLELEPMGLYFNRSKLTFERSETMVSTMAPKKAASNGSHPDE